MSRYRKIEVRIWSDKKFCSLSRPQPSGQALWFFLLTGPHTGPIPGLFRASRGQMADELGWDLEGFDEAFGEVLNLGMAKADTKAKLVWLPNALRLNKPESPNVVKSWSSEWELLPECALKDEAETHIVRQLSEFGESFINAFYEIISSNNNNLYYDVKPSGKPSGKPSDKPSGKPCPNQETGIVNRNSEQEKSAYAPCGESPPSERDCENISAEGKTPDREGEAQPEPTNGKNSAGKNTPVLKILADFGITGQLAEDFMTHRKACGKKPGGAPITVTVMQGFEREAGKAGISTADAVAVVIEANWQGFNADWYFNRQQKSQPPAANRGTGFQKQPMQRPDYSALWEGGDAIDSTAMRVS